jgi:hypothetical protein
VYLERKATVLEAGASSTLFTVRIELAFEKTVPANQSFQGGVSLLLLQIGLLS